MKCMLLFAIKEGKAVEVDHAVSDTAVWEIAGHSFRGADDNLKLNESITIKYSKSCTYHCR